jgi:hypothetical protein
MRADSRWSLLLDMVARSPVLRLIAIGFVLLFVALRWDSTTGFTGLMRFGERLTERRLPALRSLPIAPSAGDGYDGQFYAQIAVDPHVTDPALVKALDKPSYRPRRILFPLLAHILGGGDTWRILQVYALLNTAAWLVLAAVTWRLLPLGDWRATAAWCGVMLGVGTLDSVRLALTDLPAALLLVLATAAIERGRTGRAAAWFLAAVFTREISLLGALLLRVDGDPKSARTRWRTFCLRAACTAPVLVWCAWLAWRLPGPVGHEGNIDWPGFALGRELGRNTARVLAHGYDAQWVFGILGGLGLAAQSIYLLRQWRSLISNPWLSMGLPFAVLFWLIGTDPWIDYRAVARDCLPMTIVFNLLFIRRGSDHPLWLLANIAVIDGIIRMTPP